jgi:adenosylcobinamide-phosphate synthase
VVAYRSANTLDAMVGRRDDRYEAFGWAAVAAPAVGGSPRGAWEAVRRDAPAHPSPNAGVIEAAFAGALGVGLGGPLSYAGRVEARPALGNGRPPSTGDVRRAVRLSLIVGACAAVACAALREALA